MLQRSSSVRSVAMFVAGMLAAGILAVAPVGAHFQESVKHLRQHFDKRYELKGTSPITTFGQIRMNVGDPDQLITQIGPFTFTARCDQSGADGGVFPQVLISTSQPGSAYEGNDQEDDDFGPEDGALPWADETGHPPGTTPEANSEDDEAHAQAPDGTSVMGQTALYSNFAGAHCVISGYLVETAG